MKEIKFKNIWLSDKFLFGLFFGILCFLILSVIQNNILKVEDRRIEYESNAMLMHIFNEEIESTIEINSQNSHLSLSEKHLLITSNIERMSRLNENILNTKFLKSDELIKNNKLIIERIQLMNNEKHLKDIDISNKLSPLILKMKNEWNKITESCFFWIRIDFCIKVIGLLILGLLFFWKPIDRILNKTQL